MKESITYAEARNALILCHGINNPTDYQIAMFILYGEVEPSAA